MTRLDVLLLLAAAVFAVAGYRQGLVLGGLAFAGFLGGGMGGMALAPAVVGGWEPGARQALAAVLLVVVAALLGQALLGLLAVRLRRRLTWRPARLVDAGLGALSSVVAVLLVTWFVASALRAAPVPGVSGSIRSSRVLTAVDDVMPERGTTLFGSFRRLLDERGLPQVFAGLAPERIAPVDPPRAALSAAVGVRTAAGSVVSITGEARSCRRRVEGSGFVYAPERVLTNAHVVSGVPEPYVRVGGRGASLPATVVVYDPRRDLAVLAVPGLQAPALPLDGSVRRGSEGVIAGFPRGGPYRLEAARVRERIRARGPDIYGGSTVTRMVLSLRGRVEPGNSGGPLLAPDGDVYGVVFAKSRDDEVTGYALAVEELLPVTAAGRRATEPADTQGCAD